MINFTKALGILLAINSLNITSASTTKYSCIFPNVYSPSKQEAINIEITPSQYIITGKVRQYVIREGADPDSDPMLTFTFKAPNDGLSCQFSKGLAPLSPDLINCFNRDYAVFGVRGEGSYTEEYQWGKKAVDEVLIKADHSLSASGENNTTFRITINYPYFGGNPLVARNFESDRSFCSAQ